MRGPSRPKTLGHLKNPEPLLPRPQNPKKPTLTKPYTLNPEPYNPAPEDTACRRTESCREAPGEAFALRVFDDGLPTEVVRLPASGDEGLGSEDQGLTVWGVVLIGFKAAGCRVLGYS